MKKVIIPFDGNHFSKGAVTAAAFIHSLDPILLAGIFLPAVDYDRIFMFPSAFAAPVYIASSEKTDEEEVSQSIESFTSFCDSNMIEYRVHKDLNDLSIPQLTKETRFADLMIISSETFYSNGIVMGTEDYLKHAIHNTECPVLLVSEDFAEPTSIILTYDGSASSVFAIRQFAQLFPQLCTLRTFLVYGGGVNSKIPDQVLIEELAARHFPDLTLTKLTEEQEHDLERWFDNQHNALVVSGSFGRSRLSEFFRKSFVIDLILKHQLPVFVAHH